MSVFGVRGLVCNCPMAAYGLNLGWLGILLGIIVGGMLGYGIGAVANRSIPFVIDLIVTIAFISVILVFSLNYADSIISRQQADLSESVDCSQIAKQLPQPKFDTPPISYASFGFVDNLPEADTVCKVGPENYEISIRMLFYDDVLVPNSLNDEITQMTAVHPEIGESATIFNIAYTTLQSGELWRVVSFARCHALVFIKVSADVSDELISEYAIEIDERVVQEVACW